MSSKSIDPYAAFWQREDDRTTFLIEQLECISEQRDLSEEEEIMLIDAYALLYNERELLVPKV